MKKITVLLVSAILATFLIQGCAPRNPHLTEAKISMNREDFQKAKKELALVLEQEPENVEAAYLEGYIHFEEENYAGMHESFEKVRSIDSDYEKDNINNMSLRSFGVLRASGINDKFNKAVQVMSADPEVAEKLMHLALKDLELADRIKNDDFITKDIIAMIYLQLGDKDKALEMFEEAVKYGDPEKDKDNLVSAYVNISNIYLEKEEKEKALEMLNKVLEFDPENKEALLQIAKYYEENDEYDKALPMYQDILDLEPDNVDVLFNQGIAFKSNGDIEKAIKNFEKIIEINPDDTEAAYFLTVFYSENDDFQKVVDLIEPRFENFDDDWKEKISYFMQVALVKVGRAKDAAKYNVE
ncbi:MAG: tetratricopeptide repeat protein [Candidatus Delongbacteria bacterium]